MTVPDVKAALARFEKLGVEVFKPLNVATNETIPVPSGMPPLVPGFKEVYNQIAMIRVSPSMSGSLNVRIPMVISSSWSLRVSRNIETERL